MQITEFPNFPELAKGLEHLDLSLNSFKKPLKTRHFEQFSRLRHLNLRGCKIKTFPDVSPLNVTLTELNMEMNLITEIPSNILNGKQALTSLRLKGNPIRCISKIDPPNGTLTIELFDIDMYCDCCWRWLKELEMEHEQGRLRNFTVKVSDTPCKAGPDHLEAIKWGDLTLDQLTCPETTPMSILETTTEIVTESDETTLVTTRSETTTVETSDETTPFDTTLEVASAATTPVETTLRTTLGKTTPIETTLETTSGQTTPAETTLETTLGKTTILTSKVTTEPNETTEYTFEATLAKTIPTIKTLETRGLPTKFPRNSDKATTATKVTYLPMTTIDFPTGPGVSIEWNQWLPWTQCTLSCGGGTHFRLMVCVSTNKSKCTRDLISTTSELKIGYNFHLDECNTHQCPIDGYWSSWQPWTPCSATCGDGVRRRSRSCIGPLYEGRICNADDHESLLCNEKCPAQTGRQMPLIPEVTFTEADKRTSAKVIGSSAVILLAITGTAILLLDLTSIRRHLRYMKNNFMSRFGNQN